MSRQDLLRQLGKISDTTTTKKEKICQPDSISCPYTSKDQHENIDKNLPTVNYVVDFQENLSHLPQSERTEIGIEVIKSLVDGIVGQHIECVNSQMLTI